MSANAPRPCGPRAERWRRKLEAVVANMVLREIVREAVDAALTEADRQEAAKNRSFDLFNRRRGKGRRR